MRHIAKIFSKFDTTGNKNAYKAQIAATYAKIELETPPFEMGVTNKSQWKSAHTRAKRWNGDLRIERYRKVWVNAAIPSFPFSFSHTTSRYIDLLKEKEKKEKETGKENSKKRC